MPPVYLRYKPTGKIHMSDGHGGVRCSRHGHPPKMENYEECVPDDQEWAHFCENCLKPDYSKIYAHEAEKGRVAQRDAEYLPRNLRSTGGRR